MMIEKNISLKTSNTFGLDVITDRFFSFSNLEELKEFITQFEGDLKEILILGGGSNMLFSKNYEGIIIHPKIDFIKTIKETNDDIFLEVGSGINWDYFVTFCVKKKYYGAENMSLIPGNVGATAVQNAGAYGTEAKDLIITVKAYDLHEKKEVTLSNEECNFEYRNSIFKTENYKNRILITSIVYKLSKKSKYDLKMNSYSGNYISKRFKYWKEFFTHLRKSVNLKSVRDKKLLDYRFLKNLLEDSGLLPLSIKRRIVIKTRTSKLPDINELGNVGSFFKNPIISIDKANQLKEAYPDVILFPYLEDKMKVSAAWLIDKCGWSGKRIGGAGTLKHLPLTIVNYGNATSEDIITLAAKIEESVLLTFDVIIEKEVVLI
ncbi:UDP-N-acetylmuramate dehydrogenase [Cellulophaga sp. HaHaR_3_176]|uniref:UDP-N-acetylmuramate dehydrogenase n=1 Tax=Cellulophaga sp. HaHaR_3_176 TaxID=1942464 RepID=UPI001C1FD617|nr:UDP-N-acetylmuramate dehydrogenase [Cellulophaga sp. HaHaR_3_176]QWX83706.1 UDP-N-acetylmuramate dehydrogenase [Cellulophaga sp. HaHaR_3_176]